MYLLLPQQFSVAGLYSTVLAQSVGAALTANVPLQLAVFPLQFPELAATDTSLYVPIVGLDQVGAPVQLRPLLTAVDVPLLLTQVTAGAVIAVPAVPVVGTLAQLSVYVIGLATVNVPLQVAVLPLQSPELADTDTPL